MKPRSRKQTVATKQNWMKARLSSSLGTLSDLENSSNTAPMDKARLNQAKRLLQPLLEKWDADTKSLISRTNNLEPFYITFMQRQKDLANRYLKIMAPDMGTALDMAHEITGGKHAFLYNHLVFQNQIEEYGLTPVSQKEAVNLIALYEFSRKL